VHAIAALGLLGVGPPLAGASAPPGVSPAVPHVVALQQQPPAATDEFVPVDQLPPEERLPAAPLLIGAYGFVWLALFVYLVMLWRRVEKVERELSGVARRVEATRRE
jgi:CcmD family protein